ncbi:MAG TPA: bifunctional proline dehydrogenase/L-glutamate gamma-semialdehyde dehydrogenase [Polyangiaceae bacterium]|nr:bifunctional proline dehydrogenase/L-glutamate gamma-semialdehyde dehydrogenase [Polyangiaceae bacterium]
MSTPYERGISRAQALVRSARELGEQNLAEPSVELASALLEASHAGAESSERERAARLAALLRDPTGQAFVSALTDRAHRSSSGARLVAEVEVLVRSLGAPRSLAAWDRLQLRALQAFGSAVPELTARAVRRRIYEDAAPYLAPAEPCALEAFLAERKLQGLRVNVNHLGEEVLGGGDAARFLASYLELLASPAVSTISVKLSSIDARIEATAWLPTLDRLAGKLTEIYRAALANAVPGADGPEQKLVYLDMEAYRDLELTVEVFTRVLDMPEFQRLTAGIVLQAYVPDSHGYQQRLIEWARERVRRGGAPIRMRLVKGANLMLERIEASLRGWELPLYGSKAEVDSSFRRMLKVGAEPENTRAVRLGVGSHNLFDIAFTLLLRASRGVETEVEPEMLEGMADPLRRVVQQVAGKVLVYAPSVDQRDFASAVAYLVRRLDENTAEDNFLRRSFAMQAGDQNFEAERNHFMAALAHADSVDTTPRRRQDRTQAAPDQPHEGFVNEPDTDFTQAVNRRWLDAALVAAQTARHEAVLSTYCGTSYAGESVRDGFDPSRPGVVPYQWRPLGPKALEEILEKAQLACERTAAWPAEEREAALLGVARALRAARGEFVGLLLLDAGKRAPEADAEVSEAIDFAEYYARQHARLRERFTLQPKGVVVVTPPWNFPLSIALGSALAALVTGNVVLLKPPPETPLVAARAVALCHAAGVPDWALGLVIVEDEAAEPLIVDRRVNAVMLTGGTDTARLFRRLRPGLELIAETGGKNSLIVSAMSDREQAVQHAVRAAFGHAGQKCSALSLLVLEREVFRSASFREKLADATHTLPVGSAWDAESAVTPLIRPPSGALARALDTLDAGESWLVPPVRSADNPRLLGPSVRWGIQPGSFAHLTELFGPMLCVIEAPDFEGALELLNGTPYGLTAGLESLDLSEQATFLERAQAGNLYLNRPITGAVVGRQPFGGQKRSSFGPGFKAGGPNTLLALARVTGEHAVRTLVPLSRGPRLLDRPPARRGVVERFDYGDLDEIVADTLRDATRPEQERLARRLKSYETAARDELLVEHAQAEVLGFSDIFSYRPARVLVVVPKTASELDLISVLLASRLVRAELDIVAEERHESRRFMRLVGEMAPRFADARTLALLVQRQSYERIRVLGPATGPAFEATRALVEASPHLDSEPVHDAGYVELRRYTLEQSRSVARHRHGNLSLIAALERHRAASAER